MTTNSKIEWTTHTFNAWIGCSEVSPACDNCYARSGSARLAAQHGLTLWGENADRYFTVDGYWKQPAKWNREAESSKTRARVFTNSYADVFENRDELKPTRARLASVVRETPWLDWLMLTKRPEHAARLWAEAWADSWNGADSFGYEWPANVWLGTTVENQRWSDERIPHLLAVPAAIRFLSCEPLLGPTDILVRQFREGARPSVEWVIVGGESGSRARRFDVAWARSIVRQCRSASIPVFVKQLGSRPTHEPPPTRGILSLKLSAPKGGDMAEWPADLRVREFPTGGVSL